MDADPHRTWDPRRTWALDREIVLCRVIAAPRERVFEAWTDPAQIVQWFGPDGFVVESLECDIRPGGRWRFVFTGPDGTRYDNRMVFLRLEAPRLIEIEHGRDRDDDPTRFHVTLTFDAQSDGKTVLTLRQLHPTKEQRDAGIGFGAVEFGYQTLGKLARHLGAA
ncbi:SRPBCC family protein [Zavarzinia sp.]|uniref:SRPBCC family protein n=1 Tax=Zavarzinia sp. TaxID=2027920 RepID=UPI0035632CD2